MQILQNCKAYESEIISKNSHLFTEMIIYQNEDIFMILQPTSSNLSGSLVVSKNKNPHNLFTPSIYRYSLHNMHFGMSPLIGIIELTLLDSNTIYEDTITQKFKKGEAGEIITEENNPLLENQTFINRLKYLSSANPIITLFQINHLNGDLMVATLDGRCLYLPRSSEGQYPTTDFILINKLCQHQKIICCCFISNSIPNNGSQAINVVIASEDKIYVFLQGKRRQWQNNNSGLGMMSATIDDQMTLILKYNQEVKIMVVNTLEIENEQQKQIRLVFTISININNEVIKQQGSMMNKRLKYINGIFSYPRDNVLWITSHQVIVGFKKSDGKWELLKTNQLEESGRSIVYVGSNGNYILSNHMITHHKMYPERVRLMYPTNNGIFMCLTTHYDRNYKEGRLIMMVRNGGQIIKQMVERVKLVKSRERSRSRSRDKINTKDNSKDIRDNSKDKMNNKDKINKQKLQYLNFKDLVFLKNKPVRSEILDQLIPIYKKYYKANKMRKSKSNQETNTLNLMGHQVSSSQFEVLCLNVFHQLEWKEQVKAKLIQSNAKVTPNRCILTGKIITNEDVIQCQCCHLYAISTGKTQVCFVCLGKMVQLKSTKN